MEFSVAAYRFGHSMIRPQYKLNPEIERPIFGDPLTTTLIWGDSAPSRPTGPSTGSYFIDLGHDAGPGRPQLSYKIDTSLVHPLGHLPGRIAKDPSSLALRNLERGAAFQLPSGQQVAAALGITPLADEELMIGQAITDGQRKPNPPRSHPAWPATLRCGPTSCPRRR